uniref:LamG domain-containing protein n=1 Tax=Florenciella sp. virus SA2 TaxID=3240092 RepID=A0AB39JEK7_9VIRU
MKLSFLIQLLLLTLLIGVVYLLFTNSIQGKMKMILIVFCLVTGVYLFSKLSVFKSSSNIVEVPSSAKVQLSYSTEELKPSQGPIGFSTWIYIDDWNYRYGEQKYIIKPSDNVYYFPTIYLHEYKNDITVEVNVMSTNDTTNESYLYSQLISNGYEIPDGCDTGNTDLSCENGYITMTGEDDTCTDLSTNIRCSNSGPENVDITNVNMQKWVNIIATFNNRTLDIYINGKLLKSTPFNNVIQTSIKDVDGTINITPDGGFGGYVGKTDYYPYFISPSKAWSIYRGGFGDTFESALNKYNMTVSFYEDDVEKNKFYVF